MTRVYITTDGCYSDYHIRGAYTSPYEAAKDFAEACMVGDNPLIECFDGGERIRMPNTLFIKQYFRPTGEAPWRRTTEPTSETLDNAIDVEIHPIVKIAREHSYEYDPYITVVGTDETQVNQAYSDAVAAETVKHG